MSLPWAERFKPKTLQEIAGNYAAAEQLLNWIKARIEGRGAVKRAALLSGPPGTGKTLSVGIVARALDLELIEMNASDFRTEELVNKMAGGATLQASLFGRSGKLVFFDELDGISGREDRGGLGAILGILKETRYPVVLAVNDPWDPRFRPLRDICEMIQFRRIRRPSVEVQLKRIARLANVTVDDALIKRVAERAGGDLRAAINDLQMLAEGQRILRDGDVGLLAGRVQEKGIFDVMRDVFSAEGCLEAKLALEGSSVDSEMVLQWINENIPNQYTDPEERAEAYDWFSKADIFMGRVKRRQMWDLMGYAMELATGGAALARRGPYRFTRYNFPRRIGMLSQSKELRGRKREVLKAIGREAHASVKKVATEYLPYMEIMAEKGKLPKGILSWAEDNKET
ncbi:MAG: replication factor C large subunit [Candidatus Verstraetearchaeota archaeon]|nr:replication factor C large subunit [Candidatus Verstraetearchaeota archaeon]